MRDQINKSVQFEANVLQFLAMRFEVRKATAIQEDVDNGA